uniref:lipopolysaccharide biosynthesis protein n=1 Tax=uncultured Draconibacterium sp. TaxID=1573823 RepID=UPI0032168ADF
MAESLKQKAAKGLVWKFLGQGGTQFIQFVSGIYIARILSPEDYGLVGMMAIFLGISQMFVDSGFRATLIQKGNNVTHDDYNVVFIFNISVSLFFYALIYIGAPYIASFYDEPRLLWVARILGINIILLSFTIIHQTILEKRLNFRTLTKIRLVSIFISVIIGVVLAINNFGVWSLVLMIISENLIRVILLWWVNKWIPTLNFDMKIFKELFSKGIQIFVAGILRQFNLNIYAMIIGKYFTTADVGFYSQAKKLQNRIGDFISVSIQGVMYPVQSLMKDDIPRLKNAVRKNVKLTTIIIVPITVGLIVIAKSFILLFLTEKWLSSVYYLQILSIAGLIYILRASVSSFLMALGKFNIVAGLNLFNTIILIFLIIIGIALNLTIQQFVIGKVIQELAGLVAILYYSKRILKYNIIQVLIDIYPAILFSIIMGIVVFFMGSQYNISFIVLTLQVLIGICVYVVLNYFFNRRLYFEIQNIIISFLKKK